jgi:hypothetical protein
VVFVATEDHSILEDEGRQKSSLSRVRKTNEGGEYGERTVTSLVRPDSLDDFWRESNPTTTVRCFAGLPLRRGLIRGVRRQPLDPWNAWDMCWACVLPKEYIDR